MKVYRAGAGKRRAIFGAAVLAAAAALWAYRHLLHTLDAIAGKGTRFGVLFTAAFLILVWQMLLCYLERPTRVTPRKQRLLDRLTAAVSVPVYNEDPGALRLGLESLLVQTRLPAIVYVVDDGSKETIDYTPVRAWFLAESRTAGIEGVWVRQANGGKRSAQAQMVRNTPGVDIYITVDSDAILDPTAIEEILKPFADARVQSVAGIVLALNNTGPKTSPARGLRRVEQALVARVTDLWFLVGQLVDRSAMSTMGAVLVNSGPLAAYRGPVLRDNLDGYLSETFFGRKVEFSDDSMLTIYALQRGRAVQQPSAYAFTLMPETVDHHLRQYIRWMRGAFIRSWWRVKYLPMTGYAFWGHVLGWVQMVMSLAIFVMLFVAAPMQDPRLVKSLPLLFLIPILIGYGQAVRFLAIRRNDEPLRSQLLTFALAPVATLWAFTVLRAVRWYAMATCLKTGWGTRQDVELAVTYGASDETVVIDPDTMARAIARGNDVSNECRGDVGLASAGEVRLRKG